MELVVNVGLGHLISAENLGCDLDARMIEAESLESAVPYIATRSPALVLVPASQVSVLDGGVGELLERRAPRCRATVIVVALGDRDAELVIHRWDVTRGGFTTGRAPITSLGQEAQSALTRHRELKARVERLQEIGFNDCVERGGRSFHVQTEVSWQGVQVIRTTLTEEGAVRDVAAERHTKDSTDPERAEVRARSQHQDFIARIRSGRYG